MANTSAPAPGQPPAEPTATPPAQPSAAPPNPDAGATPPVEAKPAEPAASEETNGSLVPGGETLPAAEPKAPEAPKAEPIDLTKLALPEGLKADDPGLKALVDTLGDEKLSPAQRVEALAKQHHEIIGQVAKAASDQVSANYKAVNDGWIKEVSADPVIGGAKQAEALGIIAKAIDTWSPDPAAVRQALALTGAGNNPAVLRTFHAMAVALAEGVPAQGALPQGKKSAVEIFYGGAATPAA